MPSTPLRKAVLRTAVALLVLPEFSILGSASAQKTPAPATPVLQVSDLSWIAGRWVGEIGGGRIEELWSAPVDASMMGMFRWDKDGRVIVYEFLLFEDSEAGPVLRLRHFKPGLIGWEDKDSPLVLPLIRAAEGEVLFGDPGPDGLRLGYRRDGADGLVAILDRMEKGSRQVMEFRYRREPAGGLSSR